MRRGILGAAVALAVALVLGALGVHLAGRAPARLTPASTGPASVTAPAPPQPPPPPSAEELALLSPLAPGSHLAGFEVRAIDGVRDGVLRVVCGKDRAIVRLDVALVDDEGAVPPATAGRFAVFYSLSGALPEEGDRLARKLADVLRAHAGATPPPGMTTFKPKEKPGVPL